MERESLQRQVDKKMMHLKERKKKKKEVWDKVVWIGGKSGKSQKPKLLEKSECVLCEAGRILIFQPKL